jgi:DNA-binding MarR family transcriptional regulator
MSGKLQNELKKRDPFDSVEQEVILNLFRTSDRLQIRFTRLFREHGLTGAQYNILRILRGEGQCMETLEIASRTITEVPGITRLIDHLEKAGFVSRRRCTEDRRKVYIAITEAGLQRLAALDKPVRDLHRQLVGHLDAGELAELNRLLEKARENCTA